jgi:predicted membrane protein
MKKESGAWLYSVIALVLFAAFYLIGKFIVLILAIVFSLIGAYWIKKAVEEKKSLKEMVGLLKELPKRQKNLKKTLKKK